MTQSEESKIAEKYPVTKVPDDRRGSGWFSYSFQSTVKRVAWMVRPDRWQTADLVNDRYVCHVWFQNLDAALAYICRSE